MNSVLDQVFAADDFEVIVVNDSGRPLPKADWQRSERVRILTTSRRERSVARNSGAAVAQGDYLHFLDDDDWLLPGAFGALWKLAQTASDAVWLYGGIRIVDGNGKCWAEINSRLKGNCYAQIMGGAWAPIQVSFIQAKAFHKVGGYDPLMTVTQDLDLCRRLAAYGEFANTPAAIACLFRGAHWGSSTDYEDSPEFNRQSRDALLGEPGAFARLQASINSGYWHGRIVRAYVTAAAFNWRQRRFFTALSRSAYGLVSIMMSGPKLFSREFREAITAEHVPNTLYYVMVAIEEENKALSNSKMPW